MKSRARAGGSSSGSATATPPRTQRAKRQRPAPPARDQAESSFVPILRDLVARLPGALAAAVVDAEGETVDYSSARVDPFHVRIAAAHWRILLTELAQARGFGGAPREVIVRASKKSFLARTLPEDYALVVVLGRGAGFTASSRGIVACERALCREAGWALRAAGHEWFPVRVETENGRPAHLGATFDDGTRKRAQALTVLGALVGLGPRERGFRVRLGSGRELNLVREAGGFWYSDEEL
jgi:hypothetical protein